MNEIWDRSLNWLSKMILFWIHFWNLSVTCCREWTDNFSSFVECALFDEIKPPSPVTSEWKKKKWRPMKGMAFFCLNQFLMRIQSYPDMRPSIECRPTWRYFMKQREIQINYNAMKRLQPTLITSFFFVFGCLFLIGLVENQPK